MHAQAQESALCALKQEAQACLWGAWDCGVLRHDVAYRRYSSEGGAVGACMRRNMHDGFSPPRRLGTCTVRLTWRCLQCRPALRRSAQCQLLAGFGTHQYSQLGR